VLNAFNLARWRDLNAALNGVAAGDDVLVVAMRGEDGNFSAGYDIAVALGGDLTEPLTNAFRDYLDAGNAACRAVRALKKPVIATIRRYCLDGAFELAMACGFA